MRHASIRTLAFTAALAATLACGAQAQTPPPPPPPPPPAPPTALIQSGMPDALFQAITSDSKRPIVTTRASAVQPYVSLLLSRLVTRFADADQPYGIPNNPVAGEDKPPTERLVWAARIDDYYIVNWEYDRENIGASTHAFRVEPNGKARLVWSSRIGRVANGPVGEVNPYRSFTAFAEALEDGDVMGSTGRCSNLMFATPAAASVLLRRRTGPAVTDLAALPAPIQEVVKLSQGSKIKWAVPLGDHYVVDAPKDAGEVVALIRNPPGAGNRPVWRGPVPAFARFEDFQEAFRNSMSPEGEAEIRAGRCAASTRPAQTRPQG